MKTPRFEALARKYGEAARFYFVFSEEAHPRAASSARLNAFADALPLMDANHDGRIERAEAHVPQFMFDAFDLDHDGVILPHELLASRRIDDFKDFDAPRTYAERVASVARFRREVPGAIPVLVDEMDDRTSKAFGKLPNAAFVIDAHGVVTAAQPWADANGVDAALARLLGAPAPAVATKPIDWTPVAKARAAAAAKHRPLLVELTAPGCPACARMAATLSEPAVRTALDRLDVATVGVESDAGWALFESLGLHATPGFVVLGADGNVRARAEGVLDRAALLLLLQ
jgi:hypothetical protein